MNNRELWILAGVVGFLWYRAKQQETPAFVPMLPTGGGDAIRPPVILPTEIYLPKIESIAPAVSPPDYSQGFIPGGYYTMTNTPMIYPGDPGWGSYTLTINNTAELDALFNQGYVVWKRWDPNNPRAGALYTNPAVRSTR